MYILGISCYYHDAAAVLLHDGQLLAAAEEERFSRVKHDFGFPKNAIQFCLETAGIQRQDIDYAVFFEKPFRKFDRILMSVLQTYPKSWKVFRESMITWMIDKLWVASTLQSELGLSKEQVLFCEHSPPQMYFFTRASGYPSYFGEKPANYDELCERNQYYADIAASIQRVTEELLLGMARHVHRQTGMKRLCIAGGVGLNSVANGRILRETPFEELFIQPAAGDGGGALGAALWAYNSLLGKPRTFCMNHAYWGQSYDSGEIRHFLTENNIPHQFIENDEKLLDATVERLSTGKVIGWFQGRFEWGPRALGNRSILADPGNPSMKDIVNTKIKFREPYRPFAPSVLAECAETYFDLPDATRHHPARYMLYVVPVKEAKQSVLPAITHVDGTGRLQTVFREQSPRYYDLISRFGKATGLPVVLNTSFNLKGEPIVTTPANAYHTFSASEMDTLVLGNFVVDKLPAK